MAKKQKKKGSNAPKPYETPDYTDPRQLESMIRRTFKESAERQRRMERTHAEAFFQADMEPVRIKRRTAALLRYMPKVRALAEPICPDISNLFSIEEDWAYMNALPLASYDDLENDLNLLVGAAIWMLDHIKRNGRIREAVALLPREEDLMDSANMVSLYDPVHEEDVIIGMLCAIENRNGDCEIPGQKRSVRKAQKQETGRRTMSDLLTAMEAQHQDVPSRRRFEALLAMISQEDKDEAVNTFEQKLFELAELYFRCRATFCPKEQEIAAKIDRFYEHMAKRAHALLEREEQKRTVSLLQQPDPMQIFSSGVRSGSASILDDLTTDPAELGSWFESDARRLDREMDEVKFDAVRMAFYFRRLMYLPSAVIERDFGTEIAEIVSTFRPADPYEMCFALLYLLDTDSDLPWLYLPGTAIASCAGSMLPWYHTDFEEIDDWRWEQYHGSEPDVVPPPVSKPLEMADWYQLSYQNRSSDPDDVIRVNLAQTFYEATGCLLPRDLHRYDDALSLLKHYGINGKKAQLPMLYAMVVAGENRYQSRMPFVGYDFADKLVPAVMERIQTEVLPELKDKLDTNRQDELAALKQENQRLKQMAYEADREARNLRRDYEELLQNSQREHQEVSELREILFHQENNLEPELIESEEKVVLPYTVRHTTVIFGGHDSWARAIKPMLEGDIRFIDRDMQPEASLIRHAEMVWLQPNSIRHAFFYKIIKIIRTYHIPFHYFKFASAEKCARQLAGEDGSRK